MSNYISLHLNMRRGCISVNECFNIPKGEADVEELIGPTRAAQLSGRSINWINSAVARGVLERVFVDGRARYSAVAVMTAVRLEEECWDESQREVELARIREQLLAQEALERCRRQAEMDLADFRRREEARRAGIVPDLTSSIAVLVEAEVAKRLAALTTSNGD